MLEVYRSALQCIEVDGMGLNPLGTSPESYELWEQRWNHTLQLITKIVELERKVDEDQHHMDNK